MKRNGHCWLPILLILCLMLPALTGAAEGPEDYRSVLDLYAAGLAGDEAALEGDGFNFSAYVNCQYDELDPFQAIGFCLLDLDGDGSLELIIADRTEDQFLEGIVFDIWTLKDGQSALLTRGWERNRLYLTRLEDSGAFGFYREGSDSAFYSIWEQGVFRAGEAVTVHLLEYSEDMDAPEGTEGVWTLDQRPMDPDTVDAVIRDWQAPVFRPELVPLHDFQ